MFRLFPNLIPPNRTFPSGFRNNTDVIASHIIIISKQAKDYANHSIPCTPEGPLLERAVFLLESETVSTSRD